jgi:hypothetical protein
VSAESPEAHIFGVEFGSVRTLTGSCNSIFKELAFHWVSGEFERDLEMVNGHFQLGHFTIQILQTPHGKRDILQDGLRMEWQAVSAAAPALSRCPTAIARFSATIGVGRIVISVSIE